MWCSFVIALALSAGETPDAGAAPTPPTPAPPPADASTPADVAPTPADAAPAPADAAPTRVDAPAMKFLPDGTYAGPMVGGKTEMTLQLTVVHGLVTRFEVQRVGGAPIVLRPNGTPYDLQLRFGGRLDGSFLKLSGRFWDPERAFGRFEGTLDKQRVQGTWRLSRR